MVERIEGVYVARRGGWNSMPDTVSTAEARFAVEDLAELGHAPRLPPGMIWDDDDGWHIPGQRDEEPRRDKPRTKGGAKAKPEPDPKSLLF